MTQPRKRTVILISGRGSNMAALIEAAREKDYPAEVVGVVSDRADAPGLKAAESLGMPTRVVSRKDHPTAEAHEKLSTPRWRGSRPRSSAWPVTCACSQPGFVDRWQGRLVNIHPALLPAFPGLDTHRRALDAGLRIHGCSVHFVTPRSNGPADRAGGGAGARRRPPRAALAAVLKAEHKLYPLALALLAAGNVRLEGGRARLRRHRSVGANRNADFAGELAGSERPRGPRPHHTVSRARTAMRDLLLLRHAKSSWDDASLADRDRPLADARPQGGAADGTRCSANAVGGPTCALVSPARRTRETWELVAETLGGKSPPAVTVEMLYMASPADLMQAVRAKGAKARGLLVLGHNPGMEAFASLLVAPNSETGAMSRLKEKFPTAGLARFRFDGKWPALLPSGARLVEFVRPREL